MGADSAGVQVEICGGGVSFSAAGAAKNAGVGAGRLTAPAPCHASSSTTTPPPGADANTSGVKPSR